MKKLVSILSYVMIGFAFILVLLSMLCSVTISEGKVPSIMGYSAMVVSTGSMEPTYSVNTVVVVKKMSVSQYHIGDVISFFSNDPNIPPLPVTHRIVDIQKNDDKSILFITKGDANFGCDAYPVEGNNIIGKVVLKNRFVGDVISAMANRWVFLCVIILPLMLVCVLSFKEIIKIIKDSKEGIGFEEDSE